MPELNSLAIFAKVVESNSFAEAGRRLRMPIATVSRKVAELEEKIGFRLLERSTRNLKLTEAGADVLTHAKECLELSETIDNFVSNQLTDVSGTLRVSAPPNLAEAVLSPVISAFQGSYPSVSIQLLLTEKYIDHIGDEVDLSFRIGSTKDSSLVGRKLLTYRQQLLASPDYVARSTPILKPCDLLTHQIYAFSAWGDECTWAFTDVCAGVSESVTLQPQISFNDFSGIAACLIRGEGIGRMPPVVRPDLLQSGELVEVMPNWRFSAFDLVMLHLGNKHISQPVRVFKDLAARMIPRLFETLPT